MPEMEVDRPGGRRDRVPVDYPANSKKSKENKEGERPKVGKVVTGGVNQKRHGIFSQVVHNFVQEDSRSIGEYLVMDVLLPAAKTTIEDLFMTGLRRMFYGDDRPRSSGPGRSTPYATMSRFARTAAADPRPPLSRQARATHNFSDVILEKRGDAEEVIASLRELINLYGVASVFEFYELVGMTGDFTDNSWDSMDDASYRMVRGGFVLNLPPTKPISS